MARDPYKYFRVEGRELLDELTRLLMQAEKRESDKALVAKLLRLAHTLKGAAQVVKQTAIAQAAHAIEDILAPHRESPVPVPKEVADEALQRLAEIAVRIDALQSAEEVSSGDQAVQRTSAEALETVRVEVKEVEGLLASLSELDVQVSRLELLLFVLSRKENDRAGTNDLPGSTIAPVAQPCPIVELRGQAVAAAGRKGLELKQTSTKSRESVPVMAARAGPR
jgi:HPt (histidine-containing phosphotransfer) domain-containing protein